MAGTKAISNKVRPPKSIIILYSYLPYSSRFIYMNTSGTLRKKIKSTLTVSILLVGTLVLTSTSLSYSNAYACSLSGYGSCSDEIKPPKPETQAQKTMDTYLLTGIIFTTGLLSFFVYRSSKKPTRKKSKRKK